MYDYTIKREYPARRRDRESLLQQITDALQADNRIAAAYLFGSHGRGEADDLSDLDLMVVVREGFLDAVIVARRHEVAKTAAPLLVVEAPQNAQPGGAYLMALYDAAAGAQQVDWYWIGAKSAVLPPGGRLLFDKIGLPVSTEPLHFEYLKEDEFPTVLREQRSRMTDVERRADDGRNRVSFFWAMLLITAKYAARNPEETHIGLLPMLRDLLENALAKIGIPRMLDPRYPRLQDEPPTPNLPAKLVMLRSLAHEMTTHTQLVSGMGFPVPERIAESVERYFIHLEG